MINSLMKYKILFWGIFIFLLSLAPLTILPSIDLKTVLDKPVAIANLFQRIFGLILFILLFWQLILGAYMDKFADKLGVWIFDFHVKEGIAIYLLAIFHPLAYLFYRYFIGIGMDPVSVFLGFCLYCQSKLDYYYTLGRIGFWLLTVSVFTGIFRSSTTYLQVNWRKFHILNYVIFFVTGVHGFLLGSDFRFLPFYYFAIAASLVVLYTVFQKIRRQSNYL